MENSEKKNSRRDFMKTIGWASAAIATSSLPLKGSALNRQKKVQTIQKIAVISGAARGIGRATAVELAQKGMHIWGIDILGKVSDYTQYDPADENDMLETKKQVEAMGVKFNFSKADVRDLSRLKEVAQEIKSQYHNIDCVVAVAGIQTFSKILDSQTQDWRDTLDVNVIGVAHTIIAFTPLMMPKKKGKIVIISSTQGMRGMWSGAAYAASKWALIGLAKSSAMELGEYHINVNVVVPGLIYTKMTKNLKRFQVAMGPGYENKLVTEEQVKERLKTRDILGVPWLKAEEVSPVIAFLCSDDANKITGAVYDVAAGTSTIYTS
ncbi:SDR family NAD(P)-dependent oxidoreductase [Elizabethkingia argentiflava]|uniref:SDR family NAD(P)-dependent oxidoreductase n=1 Tax=Elizabethkingia argenteiflava TaxID=2681556 RepID=A0A845PUQ8_9FLAO|nr:SDR family oxidoreductase [Elizabethkingia argenteiflava]NAW51564.1 SDR family NAD(P)-dependent oxidoreductase [Elizabethkingia argenteiflava]